MKFKNKYIYNKHYKNALVLSSFFLNYILFFLSLEKCYEGEDICCTKKEWMEKKVFEESLSIILSIVLFELMFLDIISKFHLIHFSIVFLLYYSYSHGIKFEDHGLYNIKFFFLILIPNLLILFVFNYVLSVKKKKIIYILGMLFIYILINYINANIYNCKDWEKGLNNTFIDNNIYENGCIIQTPKSCAYKLGKYFLDNFKLSSEDCYKQGLKSRNKLLKYSKSPYIHKDTYHFGFPIINKEENLFKLNNFYYLSKYVSSHLIDMNNSTLLKSLNGNIPEISFDFTKKKIGEIKINLNFNQTLSDERKKLENLTNPYSQNILIVYIDSVSRANSIRQLKKTLKFIEKFMSYKGSNNPNFPSENFHSFQFFKYHSFESYTPGNYPRLFYGSKVNNLKKKYITTYLKRNGYITAYSSDSCFYDFVRSLYNFTSIDIFDHHYAICNPNFKRIKKEVNCFHGKFYLEHVFEYMEQFWRKYKNNRKFSLLLTNIAHDSGSEILKYMDDTLLEYLNKLFKDNLLKDTSIFLLSDHGIGLPSIYYLMDFYQYEKRLPMFFLIVNDRINQTYESQYKYLHQNQQSFITAYDIYNTMIHIIYGDKFDTNITNGIKSINGESIFNKINSKIRSPKLYKDMAKGICV